MSSRAEQITGSRELRVFVVADDRDMQAERDHLIRDVFPRLRRICRARGAELTEVDLLRGVHGDEKREKLLRLALDEITTRRPFIIGLLGSSLGWSPSRHVLSGDPDLARRYHWLGQMIEAERALIEIEIEGGVLADPEMIARSRFYFRDPAALEQEPGLRALEGGIIGSGAQVRHGFKSPEALGELIYSDLAAVIDSMFPTRDPVTPLDQERRAHEAFAASRRRAYVARPDLIDRLDAHVASDTPLLLITGESGSGKSALVAYWTAEYRRRSPDNFVITHHVGAASPTSSASDLLRRVIMEIRERLGTGEDVPLSREELEVSFPFWLAEASARGLLLVIDGANKLDGDGSRLAWLPEHIPAGVHLIVTANTAPERAREEAWPMLHLEPLSMNERIAISNHYLAEPGGRIDREGVIRVARDAASSNPLFLRTRLEELRMFGSYQHMSDRIDRYLSASSLDELFDRVLERVEGEYGVKILADVMGAIWGARYGLSESDLEQIVGCSRLELAELLAGLEHHLLRGDGRLRFFHDAMRQAVERRYLDGAEPQRELHLRLARYFESESSETRRADELPWQLQRAGETELLRECISDVALVKTLIAQDKEYELLGYWLACGGSGDMASAYRDALARYAEEKSDGVELAGISSAVGEFLRLCGLFDEALPFIERAVEIRREALGEEHADTATGIYQLAMLQQNRGELDDAELNFRRALAIQEKTIGEANPATARTIDNLASVVRAKGDFDAAEKLYRKALLLIERSSGLKDTYLAVCVNNLAGVLHDKGRYDEAEALYRRALAMWEGGLGAEHPNTAIAMNNLAALLFDNGKSEPAEDYYRRVVEIWERRLGPYHPLLASVLTNWGGLIAEKEPERALELLERALAIHERVYAGSHPDTAILLYTLGRVNYFGKNLEAAERYFERAYEMQSVLLGAEHVDTGVTLSALASVHRDRSKLEEGEIFFRKAVAIFERELGPNHPHVAMVLRGLADLLLRRNDMSGARETALRALAILNRSGTEHHPTIEDLRKIIAETEKEGVGDAAVRNEER